MATNRTGSGSVPPAPKWNIRAKSSPTPKNIQTHGTSLSAMATSYDRNQLSPNLKKNSWQRRSAIHTAFGKSPVSLSPGDNVIKFDYNIFVTTWQDQIKMKQYDKCEKYCREVIEKLLTAQDQHQLMNAFGGVLNNNSKSSKTKPKKPQQKQQNQMNKASSASSDESDENMHTLLEYRSKVHFSLAYLLKKYFKRHDEARQQYEESIKTDKENPGAHFNLANMLVDHYKDFATAEYHFERAISLEPTYALYRMTYAEFLWHDCNRYEDSSQQYEELIKHYSNNYDEKHQNEDIYFNYGLLLRDHLNDIPKSLIQFKRVLEINPKDNEAQEEYQYTLSLQKEAKTKSVNNNKMKQIDEIEQDDPMNDDEQPQPPQPITMKVSVTETEFKDEEEEQSQTNMNNLHSHSMDDDDIAKLDSKMKRSDYQKNRRKNSSFRRSQHEIVLPQLMGDDEDSYALKYHQAVDEKNKLNIILSQKRQQQRAMNDNLVKIKDLLNQNDVNNFRKELNKMVQNGPNYVESNSKMAFKLLAVCKNIVTQLDTMHIAKNDDGDSTPISTSNGGYNHVYQVSDSDIQYQSRLRNSSVV